MIFISFFSERIILYDMQKWQLHFFDTLESTNITARSYGAGNVIIAEQQQQGHGRCNRVWVSPKGGLYTSFVFPKPSFYPHYLSFALGLSFVQFFEEPCLLKWPNDLFLNGAKCGGILLEQHENNIIAGVGINLKKAPVCKAAYPIGCLNASLSPKQIVAEVLPLIDEHVNLLAQEGFEPIRRRWLKKAYGLGEKIQITLPQGDKIKGVFADITETGALILQTQQARKVISCGDMNVI